MQRFRYLCMCICGHYNEAASCWWSKWDPVRKLRLYELSHSFPWEYIWTFRKCEGLNNGLQHLKEIDGRDYVNHEKGPLTLSIVTDVYEWKRLVSVCRKTATNVNNEEWPLVTLNTVTNVCEWRKAGECWFVLRKTVTDVNNEDWPL